jgi:hypothetical protein
MGLIYVWPPLWSNGQSSWLQIQRSWFDSRRYQIFWVVGLERGPLSLVSTTEELLGRKSSSSSLENWDPSRWPRGTLYPQKLALTSSTSGNCSGDIVHSQTKATEFVVYIYVCRHVMHPPSHSFFMKFYRWRKMYIALWIHNAGMSPNFLNLPCTYYIMSYVKTRNITSFSMHKHVMGVEFRRSWTHPLQFTDLPIKRVQTTTITNQW